MRSTGRMQTIPGLIDEHSREHAEDCAAILAIVRRQRGDIAELTQHKNTLLGTIVQGQKREAALREHVAALVEVAERSVDTQTCSVGILRALNGAREALAAGGNDE
jgi:hypothetical protein